MTTTDRRHLARTAVADGDWSAALAALDDLETAADGTADAECLELRAVAAYGAGHFEASVTAWERLHDDRLDVGDAAEAARAAAMIAMYLMMDTGLMAPVRGWMRRAERLAADLPDAPAHALVAMVQTYERFMSGDMSTAATEAVRAIELGERLGVGPAVVIGRVAAARVAIFEGRVDDGLAQLDEVGALLLAGRADPLTTGMMYCELICAAQGLALYERAREWTEVMERWRHGAAFGGIHGRCRVHRAEVLRVSGPCEAAELEALAACEELRPWMRREYGWPLVELADIRLRRGDLDGAEAAFTEAHRHAWTPHPGLARLRLARGDVAGAAALVSDAIAHPFAVPSKERPPFVDLTLAPLLEAQAEIASAAGDVATVRSAADHLTEIASRYASPWLAASAHLAAARADLLDGSFEAAVAGCTSAMLAWAEIGAPYETAQARLLLGDVHAASGRSESASLEWRAAEASFEAFGAVGWATVARDRARGVGAATRPGTATTGPAIRRATFRREGDTRIIDFAGRRAVVRDLTGFRHLERLLVERGREFHVMDLAGGHQPSGSSARRGEAGLDAAAGGGLPVLDDVARRAYRRRLAEVDEDIAEAEAANDPARVDLARRDREYLIAELSRAVGLGGRDRTTGGDAERARTSVSRSIRYARERLREHHPELAAHLELSIRTGTYCRYEPDPAAPVHWSA